MNVSPEFTVPELDVREAKQRHDEGATLFVDCRDPSSYRDARIPGARLVVDDNVAEFVRDADKDRPVVVYCYHGIASLGGAAYFLRHGFREVYSMTGGFEAWRSAYPVERGE